MQAELASFIYADVVVAGGSYSSQSKATFLQQLEAKATELGVGYVGPDGAAAMLNGDFSVLKVKHYTNTITSTIAFTVF
jgi:hypothetical protein